MSGAKVDVKDTGEVTIAASRGELKKQSYDFIKNLTAKPEVGKTYKGKVREDHGIWGICQFPRKTRWFGPYISELGANKRVAKVGDVVKEGDEVSR